jgi:hypothetical protein
MHKFTNLWIKVCNYSVSKYVQSKHQLQYEGLWFQFQGVNFALLAEKYCILTYLMYVHIRVCISCTPNATESKTRPKSISVLPDDHWHLKKIRFQKSCYILFIQTLGVFKKQPEFQTAVEVAWGKKIWNNYSSIDFYYSGPQKV